MLHWKLADRSKAPVCGTPGAVKLAAATTTVTCPDCRAALFPAVVNLDLMLPDLGPSLAERLAQGHRDARLRA